MGFSRLTHHGCGLRARKKPARCLDVGKPSLVKFQLKNHRKHGTSSSFVGSWKKMECKYHPCVKVWRSEQKIQVFLGPKTESAANDYTKEFGMAPVWFRRHTPKYAIWLYYTTNLNHLCSQKPLKQKQFDIVYVFSMYFLHFAMFHWMAAGWCLAWLDKKRSRNEFQELQAHAEESLARNGVCGGSVNMLGGSVLVICDLYVNRHKAYMYLGVLPWPVCWPSTLWMLIWRDRFESVLHQTMRYPSLWCADLGMWDGFGHRASEERYLYI